MVNDLSLIRPSKILETEILEYKQEYFDFGETQVNVSCGLRGKGYGKQQLLLILDVARKMKVPKVMIACDKANIASAKTALSCNGILTNEIIYEGIEQQHYWINLKTTKIVL
ncbi:MAG: family N-acetyltransferase [Anaerocolumna sp.]|jgi:predicted acetyltransferase|nr:family N-acetyltransferase [Anaerocolumna sp.]